MKGKTLKLLIVLALVCALCAALALSASAAGGTVSVANGNASITYTVDDASAVCGDDLSGETLDNALRHLANDCTTTKNHNPQITLISISDGVHDFLSNSGFDNVVSAPVTMTGGTLRVQRNHNGAVTMTGGSTVQFNQGITATINGRTFTGGTASGTAPAGWVSTIAGSNDLYVNGSFASITSTAAAPVTMNGDLTINGTGTGSVTVEGSAAHVLTVNGGIVWIEDSFERIGVNGGSVADSDAVTINSVQTALAVTGGTVNLDNDGSSITGNNDNNTSNEHAVKVSGAHTASAPKSSVTIDGYTITAGNAAPEDSIVYCDGGKLTIKNSTIEPLTQNNGNVALKVNEITASVAHDPIEVEVTNTGITSHNPSEAVYVLTRPGTEPPPTAGACDVTFNGTTEVDAKDCASGVFVSQAGSFEAAGTTTITADVYGINATGNDTGIPLYVFLTGSAEINVNSDNAGNTCYGMYGDKDSLLHVYGNSEINAVVNTDSGTAYGVYTNTCPKEKIISAVIGEGGETTNTATVNVTSDAFGSLQTDVRVYGAYGNDGTILVQNGADINVTTNCSHNHGYGLYAAGTAQITQTGGAVDVLVDGMALEQRAEAISGYGVYALDADSLVTLQGGTLDVTTTNNTRNAELYGICTDSGDAVLNGTVVTVDNDLGIGGDKITYGALIYDNEGDAEDVDFTFSSGSLIIMIPQTGARGYGVVIPSAQTTSKVIFTGGEIYMDGATCQGITNEAGLVEMGEHLQPTYDAANPGTAGNPYIEIKAAVGSHGVHSSTADAKTKLFAGMIDIHGGDSYGIYVQEGNVQVLTNAHDAPVGQPENITFITNVLNASKGAAFYAAGGNYAIRGRGSVFTASTNADAFYANVDLKDGGVWYDPTCHTDAVGEPHNPLSGGTFVGDMVVSGGAIADTLLSNHYLRNDSDADGTDYEPDDYTQSSNGTFAKSAAGVSVSGVTTVVDAERELRYALEIDNDINDYYMPCDILLDDNSDIHGTGKADGDVDVAVNDHILNVRGFSLTSLFDDNGTDNLYEQTDAAQSVIEVGMGTLTTFDSEGTGFIEFTGQIPDSATIHVTGGEYSNGTGVLTVDGVTINGFATGNAIRVNAGTAYLYSGFVGNGTSNTAVWVNGLSDAPAAELNVSGGTVTGASGAGIGILVEATDDTFSTVEVSGGDILGNSSDTGEGYLERTAIEINGGAVDVETAFAHEIGTVVVNDGMFNLYDGTLEGKDSTIYALMVDGNDDTHFGSAYVDGGIVVEDSKVEGFGQLKADNGLFKGDLALSENSETYFIFKQSTEQGVPSTWGKVDGVLSVDGPAATLLVQEGDFAEVTTNAGADNNISLHGGSYMKISTTGSPIIGEVNMYDKSGLIPVNHFLIGLDGNYEETGVLYRTDKGSEMVNVGGEDVWMGIKNICEKDKYNIYAAVDDEDGYVMPGFIDLCAAEENVDGEIAYEFRSGDLPGVGGTFVCCDTDGMPGMLTISRKFDLDLNGYELTSSNNGAECYPLKIVAGGDLTVQDKSGTKPDGHIVDGNNSPVQVTAGRLTLNSGTIESTVFPAIKATGNSNVNVAGGLITASDANGLEFDSAGALNISNGELASGKTDGYALYVDNPGATVTVRDGTFGLITGPRGGAKFNNYKGVNLTGGKYTSIETAKDDDKLIKLIPNSGIVVTAASVEHVSGQEPDPGVTVPRGDEPYALDAIAVLKDESPAVTGWKYRAWFTLASGQPPVPPAPPEPGPGGGGGGGGAPILNPVIVDGVVYNIGTRTVSGTTTTETVDQTRLNQLIAGANSSVVVPVTATTNTVITQLVVKNVEDMAARNITLTVQTGDVSYVIPAQAVDTASIMSAVGATNSAEVPFRVITTKNVAAPAVANNYEVIGSPVSFSVIATSGDKSVEATKYMKYTSRVFEVTETQAKRITTGVVNQGDGTVRHVPTDVYTKDGKWYAKVNSLTDSVYVLIQNEQSFADAAGTWYQGAVNEMASRKILNGRAVNFFDGGADITRAEFAAIVVRALGLPESGASAFTDVPGGAWYYGAVGKASEYGIIEGVGGNRFEPLRNITRQEAMLMLQRAAKITGYVDVKAPYGSFADLDAVSDFAESAMYWNLENGFIIGSNGLVRPLDNISRAESSTIILRLLQKSHLIDVRTAA